MKIFHKKFLIQEQRIENEAFKNPVERKFNLNYFFNQFIIWITILFVLYFIINFLNININLN